LCEVHTTHAKDLSRLSGVCSHMAFQLPQSLELLTTILPCANESFVFPVIVTARFRVPDETASKNEALVTDVTCIRLIFDVSPEMTSHGPGA
jgi:hypothetical protein